MTAAATREVRTEFRELERAAPPPPPWRRTVLPRVGGPSARPLPELRYLPFGHEVAAELDGVIGEVLWRAVRQVRDWVDAGEHGRAAVFPETLREERGAVWTEARAEAPLLSAALAALEGLAPAPSALEAAVLARACSEVADWAETRGARATALHFAEAGARLLPDSAGHARAAGRFCRLAGEWARSESWYLRSIRNARVARDVAAYTRACLGYGTLAYDRGDMARARRLYGKAGNAAQASGRDRLACQAWHDMLNMCSVAGDYTGAVSSAVRAAATYPVHHSRLPALAHDVAAMAIRQRYYSLALPLLQAVVEHFVDPAHAMLAWSTLAPAAAGSGKHALAEEACGKVLRISERISNGAAYPVLNVAIAAWLLGNVVEARSHAERSHDLALTSGERSVAERASWVLTALDGDGRGLTPSEPRYSNEGNQLRWLFQDLLLLVSRWRGPTWRRGVQAGPAAVGKL